MKKVSIIVPIYNVEKYLEKCLTSLVNQTLEDIEIILINDKSPDRCDEIMEQYKKQYPQKIVTVYLPTNQKQGTARNIGIKIAKGEYLLFVDSDDWVDTTMCEKLYTAAKAEEAEIAYCDYSQVWEGTGKYRYMMDIISEQAGILTKEKKKSLLVSVPYGYPVAKLILRQLILDNKIFFAERIKYEDKVAAPFFYLYATKLAKINEALYYYNQRDNSTVSSKNEPFQFDRMKAINLFYDEMKSRELYDEYKEEVDMCWIREYLTMLHVCMEKFDHTPIERMNELRLEKEKRYPEHGKNKYTHQVIDPLYIKIGECNDISSSYLAQKYRSESNFFKDVSFVQYYTGNYNRSQKLLQSLCNTHNNVAIWGAGRKGEDFLQVCDGGNKWIKYVIDGNKEKEGTILPTGHVVQSFEAIKDFIDVVLVINRHHYGEIYTEINNKLPNKIKMVHLDNYLIFDIN